MVCAMMLPLTQEPVCTCFPPHPTFLFALYHSFKRANMGEVVNVIVAFAVIVFIFRWVTSGMTSSRNS